MLGVIHIDTHTPPPMYRGLWFLLFFENSQIEKLRKTGESWCSTMVLRISLLAKLRCGIWFVSGNQEVLLLSGMRILELSIVYPTNFWAYSRFTTIPFMMPETNSNVHLRYGFNPIIFNNVITSPTSTPSPLKIFVIMVEFYLVWNCNMSLRSNSISIALWLFLLRGILFVFLLLFCLCWDSGLEWMFQLSVISTALFQPALKDWISMLWGGM